MNLYTINRIVLPIAAVGLLAYAYHRWGWGGLFGALGLVVMWMLLHFTRMMQVLKRTADRPVGYVDSAVMLNAKLQKGMTLLHVLAMTRALGQLQSAQDAQPEVFCWTDAGGSFVNVTFFNGRVQSWVLTRPDVLEP
jgi:hypothetical protein